VLENQWGDDWNDAPYEHNAGAPYDHGRDKPPVEITEIVFDSSFEPPSEGRMNSLYSVEQINSGRVPWLKSPSYRKDIDIKIFAGCTLGMFIQYIKMNGGRVFMELA
jgi:hypothetical protein